jgi:hypothetical protein
VRDLRALIALDHVRAPIRIPAAMGVDEGTTDPEHTGAPDQGSYQGRPVKLAHTISLSSDSSPFSMDVTSDYGH